jgi:asparagine synthase (glutamine-hydrolysing)
MACYTDFAFVQEVFGTQEVERRLETRLQYVLDLCPFLSADERGLDAHLEAGHMVDYFCDDAVSLWRQSSMSYGGFLVGPFTHPAIVRSALTFPRRGRYWHGGETKPALKALLRYLLPQYDTSLPKLSTGFPIQRFLEAGPLRSSPYAAPPEFFPPSHKLDGRKLPHWIAWSMTTLSAWRRLARQSTASPPVSFSRTLPARRVHAP